MRFWQYKTYGDIRIDYEELVPNNDPPNLFTPSPVQHCAAISAIAEL